MSALCMLYKKDNYSEEPVDLLGYKQSLELQISKTEENFQFPVLWDALL